MRKIIFISYVFLMLQAKGFTQTSCPTNLSFDANNISFWEFQRGTYSGSYNGSYTGTVNAMPSKVSTVTTAVDFRGSNALTIFKANPDGTLTPDELEPSIKKVPVINGYKYDYSVRIGNSVTGGSADKLTFRLQVPSGVSTYNITYAYAALLQDPGHAASQQPAFAATVNDLSQPSGSQKIDCASKRYYANNTLPVATNNIGVKYISWQEVSFDLSQYAGKTIELKFEAFDCQPTGHFGYAYLAFRNDGCGTGTISGDNIICSSSSSLTFSTPSVDGASYTWTLPVGWTGSSTSNTITVNPNSNSGGNITVTPSQSCGNITTRSLAITTVSSVPETPGAIVGNTNVCSGSNNLVYSVPEVTGASSYTWTYPSGWTIVDGLNTNRITFNANSNPGNITVKSSNLCGNSSVSSSTVSITNDALSLAGTISGLPGTIQCPNYFTSTPRTLSLGTSTGSVQNWLSSTDGGINWTNIANSTSSLVITPNTSTLYKAVVKNGSVCVEDESDPVLVEVYSPIQILNQPVSVNTCANLSKSFSVSATSDGTLSYNWQVSSNNGISWTNISSAPTNYSGITTSTLTVNSGNVTLANNGLQYRCILTSSVNCDPVTSSVATLNVSSSGTPVINSQPSDQIFCSGSVANISLTATGPSLTYQWQTSNDNVTFSNVSSGGTSASLSISTASASVKYFKCVVTETCGSLTNTSAVARIEVATSSTVSTTISSTSSTICAGTNKTFSATPTNGGSNPVYAWYKNGSVISGQTAAIYSTTDLSNGDAVYATLTSDKACAIGSPASSNTISTIVNTLPAINNITGLSSVNIGSIITLANTTSNGTWSSADPGVASVSSSGTVTGVSQGNVNILYSITDNQTPACTNSAIKSITVNALAPSGLIYTTPNVYNKGTSITALNPTVSGGTVTGYSITPSLPSGLVINSSTGIISGTPTVISPSTTYTVTATNSGGSVSTGVNLTVNDVAPSGLSYTTPNVYIKGTSITALNPTVSGGTVTGYTITPSLPNGLVINSSTGIISGTPTVISPSTTYTVTATNSGGSVSTGVNLTVNDVAPSGLSYTTPNVYIKGTTITALNPTVSGGAVTGYTITPSLPTGLVINSTTGIISGTPTVNSASTNYTVTASNSGGSISAVVNITVKLDQPQGGFSSIDYTLLNIDTLQFKVNITEGTSPFTIILTNNQNAIKDTISNLSNGSIFKLKPISKTRIFSLYKLIDAGGSERITGFTKDTSIINIAAPNLALTLKAETPTKQTDNSFKTKLLIKLKNVGELGLKNVQVNANLSEVFPNYLNYTLDSIKVKSGNVKLNTNYTGRGSATTLGSTLNNNKQTYVYKSNSGLDVNYLLDNGVNLAVSEEAEVQYYMSIAPTPNSIVLKLQFETEGQAVITKNDGSVSQQVSKAISDNGISITSHPNITSLGIPLPTYLPLYPIEKIGVSLSASNASIVSGGYTFDFVAKIKNYSNLNLDTVAILNVLSKTFTSPDTAFIINTPVVTGGIKFNTSFNGFSNTLLIDSTAKLAVGDSATISYSLKVLTDKINYTWLNSLTASGHSTLDFDYIKDNSVEGLDPDPNGDKDPLEQTETRFFVSYVRPDAPVVSNVVYTYNTNYPKNLNDLVKSYPTNSIPVWCDLATLICNPVSPSTPTIIGKYIYYLKSYDTVTKLYSLNYVNDTVIIKPPVPVVNDSTYIIGQINNPLNVGTQVKAMTDGTLKYFLKTILLNTVPSLGNTPGITSYTVSQVVNQIESDTASFRITLLHPNDVMHLQKIAGQAVLQSNSSFNIPFTFIARNVLNKQLDSVLITDNLMNSISSPGAFSVVNLSGTGGLVTNSNFNGKTDINVTTYASKLIANAIDTIKLVINVIPNGYSGILENIAILNAKTPYGKLSMNSSSKAWSSSDITKFSTLYTIADIRIDIPEGFSPNRDGVNDRFVIIKPYGTILELEVFNRWGNIVYSNPNYNNEWDGRGTNNFIGQDLLDGGYYYTLKAKSANGNIQIFKGFVLIQR